MFEEKIEHGRYCSLQIAKVYYDETNWKVKVEDIPKTKTGINYNIRQAPQFEIHLYIQGLQRQGIVQEMRFEERGFFSLVMFLKKARKAGRDSMRKVVDFRLTAYSRT